MSKDPETREASGLLPREFAPEQARPADLPAEIEGGVPAPVEPAVPRARRWGLRLFFGSAAALVVASLGFDTAALLGRAWAVSPWLGGAVGALVIGLLLGLIGLAAGEMAGLRRLERVEALRARDGEGGKAHAAAIAGLYRERPDLRAAVDALQRQVTDAHDEAEAMALVDRILMNRIDARAYELVLRAARDTALATAVSPSALLDAALVVWRNLRLVREIATLYGIRPGWVGGVRLLRRITAHLAVAGVADTGSDLVVEGLGSGLAAAVSARLGQGMVNGLLTARIGLSAMQVCRPLPFPAGARPSLGKIRRALRSIPNQIL
ncbi:TIGR01620 family protein [Arenibaculum pallidiluteum]|uniref:TIGR01620 family protein n=1 Tax=Arenibaculum pallidiluteum TaxID=2812559 RepID=UPI001A96A7B8|nr:TIGR01620 family protein [Arenibaculum pallidiluteum]